MMGKYDAAACVTELQTRKTISDALRSGWRPAADGCLPAPATPAMQHIAFPGTPLRAMAPGTPVTEVMNEDICGSNVLYAALATDNRGQYQTQHGPPSETRKQVIAMRVVDVRIN